MFWTQADDDRLRTLAAETHLAAVAREMGVSDRAVQGRAYRLKIKALPEKESRTPTEGEWIGKAIEAAREAKIDPRVVLGRSRMKQAARARWRAWRRLLDEHPQYSIAGMARVSGLDHTTVLHGLRRLREIS